MQLSVVLKDLVLIGGGHSHVHTIKSFGMSPIPGVRLTLISKDVETPYSGMLPGYVAGYYSREQCHIDLLRLCSIAKVRFIRAEANQLDALNKLIYCKDNRPPLSYDITSIDIGITPKLPHNMRNMSHTLYDSITPVKPIDGFCARWDQILHRVLHMNGSESIKIAVVGGGAGGVELAFAIHHRLVQELQRSGRDESFKSLEISIIHSGAELMSSHNKGVRRIVSRLLSEKGIRMRLNTKIDDVTIDGGQTYLIPTRGARIAVDEAIWCTQAAAQTWLREAGLDVTEEGFVCVENTLESTNTRDVFACGDVSHLVHSPLPKAGVFAVRAGPPLTANLRNRLLGRPLDNWTPQTQFLGIIGTGDEYAIASRGPLAIEGKYLWTLKEHIDNTWMAGYRGSVAGDAANTTIMTMTSNNQSSSDEAMTLDITDDERNALAAASMRCGGCGSKIGSRILSRLLSQIRERNMLYARDEVVLGVGDDAALVTPPTPASDYLQVHTVDYFRSFISDSYLFGKIAAIHALSDIYSMNGEAVTALATCIVPYGLPRKVEEDLTQMVAGICAALKEEQCMLVGGHSSEGVESAIGINANGIVRTDQVFNNSHLHAGIGDVLIITKALGTGVLFAADMRGQSKGPWIWSALQSMAQSNKQAAQLLYEAGCKSCTDITGFGLVGHLTTLLQGSTRGNSNSNNGRKQQLLLTIDMDALPILVGANEVVKQGYFSSLHEENLQYKEKITNFNAFTQHENFHLLFDPQTSGGLCGIVAQSQARDLLLKLKEAGYTSSAIIGEITSSIDSDADMSEIIITAAHIILK